MDDATRFENEQFENDVRRIARELWPAAEYDGAAIVDRRETDGVFDTEECRHLVEATTSRKRSKAEDDIRKLSGLVAKLRAKSGTRAIRGWFITRDEPTAEQRSVAERHRGIINLRDHYGQDDPAEILHRHAKSVGFGTPHHLVRAWRAGYVHLLLDGFDEITALYIQGQWRRLKDNRYRAMAGIRRLIQEHPRSLGSASTQFASRAGLLVAGRAHFFDNPSERRRALGLPTDALEVSLRALATIN